MRPSPTPSSPASRPCTGPARRLWNRGWRPPCTARSPPGGSTASWTVPRKPLVAQTRVPLPTAPGQPARQDYEYERCGTANLFLVTEPLVGQRRIKVTQRRTAVDFAEFVRDIVDRWYPDAQKIVLVMDNLNTHKLASLYEAFAPEEARRLVEKLEIHYTPKHGSWLNIAEIEFSLLSRQCLDRRLGGQEELRREI